MPTVNNTTLVIVQRTSSANPCAPDAPATSLSTSTGISTSASTVSRSSTMSQPTVTLPAGVSISFRSVSVCTGITVLQIEIASPRNNPACSPQPHRLATPATMTTMTNVWINAPGTAILRTASKSLIENWMPTPNISRMIPTSASCAAISESAANPGVNGPIATPASRNPSIGGSLSRAAA